MIIIVKYEENIECERILCLLWKKIEISSNEHIIQNALGGLYESTEICCGECNNFISENIDVPFASTFNYDMELAADVFAGNKLLSPESYEIFVQRRDFSIEAICKYAKSQNVMPYIVIGRLQKEKYLNYRAYSEYKLRYKWEG